MNEVEDAKLLDRARKGAEDAFAELFARHHRAIFRYAAHMCGRDAGDDIVQETFLAVLKPAGRYDASHGSVGAYLFGIARHCALKRIGVRSESFAEEDLRTAGEPCSMEASALDELSRAEVVEAVRTAVDSLPPQFREAVVLCELEEMDYAAAAEVMRCPIGTVRSRVHRAKALLSLKLTAQAVVGPRS
jgi:RNA polymerase sigma-70 factor (ECF subfamily)